MAKLRIEVEVEKFDPTLADPQQVAEETLDYEYMEIEYPGSELRLLSAEWVD